MMCTDEEYIIKFLKKLIDNTTSNSIKWERNTNYDYEAYTGEFIKINIGSNIYVAIYEEAMDNSRKHIYIITNDGRELIADDSCVPSVEIGELVSDLYDCAQRNADSIILSPETKLIIEKYLGI